MINLSEYMDSVFISESFKSSVLRDLVQLIKNVKNSIDSRHPTDILPKGVAWDQITDDEINYGESGDKNFVNKFINPNYLVIWYPLFESKIPGRKLRGGGIQYDMHDIDANYVFISLGKKMVYYNARKYRWDCSDVVKPSQQDVDRINNATIQSYSLLTDKESKDNEMPHLPTPFNVVSVEKLIEFSLSACIAIHKDVLAKYSTVQKMIDRLNQKRGATAFDRKKVHDEYYTDPNKWSDNYSKKLVDYPNAKINNIKRYKDELAKMGGASDEALINFIDNLMSRIKPLKEFFDNFVPKLEDFQQISNLTGGKYIDMLFNSPLDSETIGYFESAKRVYTDIFTCLEQFVDGAKRYKKSIAQMKDSYVYGKIEENIKQVKLYINKIKQLQGI